MELTGDNLFHLMNFLDETIIIFSENGEYLKVMGANSWADTSHNEDFTGKTIQETLSADTAELFLSKITEALSAGTMISYEYQISDIYRVGISNGGNTKNTRFFRAKIVPAEYEGRKCAVWIAYDITEMRNLEVRYSNSVIEDPVTGVFNRRYIFKELNKFFQRFMRGSSVYSVIIVNLDHSEKLSDTYGTEVSERMMNSFIGLMKSALRNTDLFANSGNEDFLVLLPDTPSNGAALMAERLRSAIANNIFEMDGEQFKMTASFGCSEVSEKDSSYDNLINRAEIALYQAKHSGGNTVNRLDYHNWAK